MQKQTAQKSGPPYLLGLLGLIPLIGAFVGLGLLLYGLLKYKDKWLSIIGAAGIAWTVLVYSMLFYTIKHSSTFKEGFAEISQVQMNELVKSIEFHKQQYGNYPDNLQQVQAADKFAPINDAIQLNQGRANTLYNYKRVGDKYMLFSSGEDGIPNTKDDLFPTIVITDSSKIGLIRN